MITSYTLVSHCNAYCINDEKITTIGGAPPAPSSLTMTKLSSGDSTLTVNLTWSQQNSRYIVMYYVEVNYVNISITNKTTTSQYIVLPLQIGEYFFRVRGADSINRLGEWSDYLMYNASKPYEIQVDV